MSQNRLQIRRPAAAYYAWAIGLELLLIPIFLLTGAGDTLDAALTSSGIDFNTDLVTAARLVIAEPSAWWPVLLAIAQVATPDIALGGLSLSHVGRGAVGDVRERFRFWKRSIGVRRGLSLWISIVALFCAMNLASAFLHSLTFSAEQFSWTPAPGPGGVIVGLLVAMFLDAGAVFEENGWRGFLLPRMQAQHRPLLAAVIVGLLWSVWHLPVKFNLLVDYGVWGFLGVFAVMTVKLIALSIIISFFFNSLGEATIAAIAMHGLSNDSVRLGGLTEPVSAVGEMLSEFNLAVPMVVVAAVMIACSRGRLGYLQHKIDGKSTGRGSSQLVQS